MYCPYCKNPKTKVVDKRDNKEQCISRRRRECLNCSKRFTTYERIEKIELFVIKSNGNKELFDSEKLLRSIKKSFAKNSPNSSQAEKIAEEIEQKLINLKRSTITTKKIGRMVLKRLLKVDRASYMRYASVYKSFKDLEDFLVEIKKII